MREVTIKIGLKKINIQERITIEMLLDNRTMELVMSLKFTRKQRFKLKKIERLIYMRNVDSIFNKKRPIENTMEVDIYYQRHRERTEIDVIREQKCNVILRLIEE